LGTRGEGDASHLRMIGARAAFSASQQA
jgi:hypothetical protein